MLGSSVTQLVADAAVAIAAFNLPHPARVGIDGFCGAGKTTFATALAGALAKHSLPVVSASTDDFQTPPEVRWQLGEDSPEGFHRHAIDFVALRQELLGPLGPNGSLRYRISTYDIRALQPSLSDLETATTDTVLLVDGLFLHAAELEGCFDFSVFVHASFDTCIRRARLRNQERRAGADEVEALYRRRYVPGWKLYLEEAHPEEAASLVIRNDGQ